MSGWRVDGVGDIHIRHNLLTLIDIAGHLTVTPAEARALAAVLLEAAATTGESDAVNYVIRGMYPAYTVTANGEHFDQTTELKPVMNMLRDRLNPGDTITWTDGDMADDH